MRKPRQVEIVLGLAVITGVMLFALGIAVIAIIGVEGIDALLHDS